MLAWTALPTFGLIDTARIPDILTQGFGQKIRFESLYRGKPAEELAEVAPYLVQVNGNHELMDYLVREAWGLSWGLLLSSRESADQVRRHLRKFLMVRLEDGRQMYFRYYDPRVLHVFLPTCTSEQLQAFFGPIDTIWAEGDREGSWMSYTLAAGRLERSECDITS